MYLYDDRGVRVSVSDEYAQHLLDSGLGYSKDAPKGDDDEKTVAPADKKPAPKK